MVLSGSLPRSAPHCILATNATVAQALLSPIFDFRGVTPSTLEWYTRRSSSFNAAIVCEASTDGGLTYPFRMEDSITADGSTIYMHSCSQLPGVLAGEQRVRFRWRVVQDATGTSGTLRVDDVTLTARAEYDVALRGMRTDPALPHEGDSITVMAVVVNVGSAQTGPCSLELYRDANGDRTAQAGEILVRLPCRQRILPGDSSEISAAVGRLPGGTAVIIGILVDSSDRDQSNNQMLLSLEVTVPRGRVALNEAMIAPAGGEAEWIEIVGTGSEPVNLKDWMISDATMSRHRIAFEDILLEAGMHIVLTRDSLALVQSRPGIPGRILGVPGFPSLNNEGDLVVLFDSRGGVIDSVAYRPDWGGGIAGQSLERIDVQGPPSDPQNWGRSIDPTGATAGRENSIGRKEHDVHPSHARSEDAGGRFIDLVVAVVNAGRLPASDCAVSFFKDSRGDRSASPGELLARLPIRGEIAAGDSAVVRWRWASPPAGLHALRVATDFAMDQRRANDTLPFSASVRAERGVVVINEIMFAPVEGESEYVELLNTGGGALNLAEWRIGDRSAGGSPASTVAIPGELRTISPGATALIATDSSIFRFFPEIAELDPRLVIIPSKGMFTLNNDGDDVILRDPAGNTVDSVGFIPAWHNPAFPDTRGRSLERILPHGSSTEGATWTTCTLPQGGTPGRRNSVALSPTVGGALVRCSPNPFSPDGDGSDDATVVHYALPAGLWSVHATVFDAKGRHIRQLATSAPGVGQGDLIWDGRDDQRIKARMGIYIVLIEAFDEQRGGSITAKCVVVLAGSL